MFDNLRVSGTRAISIAGKCSQALEKICQEEGLKRKLWKSLPFGVNVYEGQQQSVMIQRTANGTYIEIQSNDGPLSIAERLDKYIEEAGFKQFRNSNFTVFSTSAKGISTRNIPY